MTQVVNFLKSGLVTGLLLVLPAYLAVLLFIKVLVHLGGLVKPVSSQLPDGINHPTVIALLSFLIICFIVGVLVKTAIGRVLAEVIDQAIFSRIPGYDAIRSITSQLHDFESEKGFKPSMIEVEDGSLSPAFLIETHNEGLSTVFVPSVPTPMAGAILIMASSRVHPIDVSVPAMMKYISKWGSGSEEILSALSTTGVDLSRLGNQLAHPPMIPSLEEPPTASAVEGRGIGDCG